MDVDHVVLGGFEEEGLSDETGCAELIEEGEDLFDPMLVPDRGWWPGMVQVMSSASTAALEWPTDRR